MTIAIYLPIPLSVLLALAPRPLSRRLAPRSGAWGLAMAAAVVAASSIWTLSLLVLSLVDDLPDTPLLEKIPVPDGVSVVAYLLLVWCGYRVGIVLWERHQIRRHLRSVVAGAPGELVVVPEGRPQAFAVAGRPGRIVVTVAMLRALSLPQRRVMLAHERAHLRRRHSLLLATVQLAAAANPLLIPVRDAVGYLCERHADEVAAGEAGDRLLVAEALAAAAFATTSAARAPAPGFHRTGVAERVTALVTPPRRYWSAALVTAAVIAVVALTAAWDATDQFFELIRAATPT